MKTAAYPTDREIKEMKWSPGMSDYQPGYTGSKKAPPERWPEITDPPRPWEEWGPAAQAETLREGIRDVLFEYLEGK